MSRRPPSRARETTSHSSSSGSAAARRAAEDDDDEQEMQKESRQEDASDANDGLYDAADSSSADDADGEEDDESELRLDRRHPFVIKRPCVPYLCDGRRSKNATEKQFAGQWKPEHGRFFWMYSCLTRDPTKSPDFKQVFISPANDEEKATNKASKRSMKEYEENLQKKAAKDPSLKLFRWHPLILLGDAESDIAHSGSGAPHAVLPSSVPAATKTQHKAKKAKKTEKASSAPSTPAAKGNQSALSAAGSEAKYRSGVRQDVSAAGAMPATPPNVPVAATTRSKTRSSSSGAAREDTPSSARVGKQNLDKKEKTAPSRSSVRSRANEDSNDEDEANMQASRKKSRTASMVTSKSLPSPVNRKRTRSARSSGVNEPDDEDAAEEKEGEEEPEVPADAAERQVAASAAAALASVHQRQRASATSASDARGHEDKPHVSEMTTQAQTLNKQRRKQWGCKECTFDNDPGVKFCSLCLEPR